MKFSLIISFLILIIGIQSQIINLRKNFQETNDDTKTTLANQQYFQYYAKFQLGSQKETVKMIINPRQFYNWIYERPGHYIASESQSANISESTTYTNNYPKGVIRGKRLYDDLASTDLNISSVRIFLVLGDQSRSTDMEYIIAQGYDGSLGLNYNSLDKKNFLDLAKESGELESSQFGLILNDEPKMYIDQNSFPSLTTSTWFAMSDNDWDIEISKTVIGTTEYQQVAYHYGMIEINSNSITLEAFTYEQFMKNAAISTNCVTDNADQFGIICKCQDGHIDYPQISYKIIDKNSEEQSISITANDYLIQSSAGSAYCYLSVLKAKDVDRVLTFGSNILKNYFLTFDKDNKEFGIHTI